MIRMVIHHMNRYGYSDNYNTRKRLNHKVKKAKKVICTIDIIKHIIYGIYIIWALIESGYVQHYIMGNSMVDTNRFIFGSAIFMLIVDIANTILLYEFYKTIKRYIL